MMSSTTLQRSANMLSSVKGAIRSSQLQGTCVRCTSLWSRSSDKDQFRRGALPNEMTRSRAGVGESGQKRFIWGWLNSVFNKVDPERIKEVGPDRACAEWLLRCGAGVKWDRGSDEWLKDYNSLPAGNFRSLKILEIDATDSAIMHIGFPHFKGLNHVKKAVFHRCMYLEDEAIRRIGYLKETLEELQISSCGNVTDEGILTLVQMENLKKLVLYDFLEVRNRLRCLSVLKESLPKCDIHFPFAREKDRDPSAPRRDGEKTGKS